MQKSWEWWFTPVFHTWETEAGGYMSSRSVSATLQDPV